MFDINTTRSTPQALNAYEADAFNKIHDGVLRARILSNDILDKEFAQQVGTHIVPSYHTWMAYPWSTHTVHVVHSDSVPVCTKPASKKKDDGALFALGVVASAVALIAVVGTGSALRRYHDSSEGLEQARSYSTNLPRYINELRNAEPKLSEREKRNVEKLIITSSTVAPLKEKILRNIRSSAMTDLFLNTVTLAASTATAVGAFVPAASVALPAMVTVGAATMGGALITKLFKAAYESVGDRNAADAAFIRNFRA